MDRVTEYTEDLIAAIRASDAYARFTDAKAKVQEQPELYARINQFRKQNYELQNMAKSDNWLERLQAFENENREFRKDPLADEFLLSELELCRMIQRINISLAKTVDFGIENFADDVD